MDDTANSNALPEAKWRPIGREDRRVVGVLVEKAKTTPENYPLSLNALVNGCNQKSNRFPQMQLDSDRVEESIDRLRLMGAVAIIEGGGRVDKYRHLLYDWLGVDKVELAVMAELLLRGAQTLGELRARAARMESISGIAELRPVVDRLREKGLLVLLTPSGRGCVVTHALYEPQELEKLRAEHGNVAVDDRPLAPAVQSSAPPAAISTPDPIVKTVAELQDEVRQLREEVAALKDMVQSTQSS